MLQKNALGKKIEPHARVQKWKIAIMALLMVGVGSNISSVVEFQRWWVLKSKIFAMWWPSFKDFIWFFEMEEHGASEAHKNDFLNYEVFKI